MNLSLEPFALDQLTVVVMPLPIATDQYRAIIRQRLRGIDQHIDSFVIRHSPACEDDAPSAQAASDIGRPFGTRTVPIVADANGQHFQLREPRPPGPRGVGIRLAGGDDDVSTM